MKTHRPYAITLRYLTALGILALLAIVAYSILLANIRLERSSAAVVNISGRQRMLSQRIAFFSLQLANAKDAREREVLRAGLSENVRLFERSHKGLIYGDPEIGLPGRPSSQVKEIHFSSPHLLDAQAHRYILEAKSLLDGHYEKLDIGNPHLEFILSNAKGGLLRSLDSAVQQYQKESEEKVARHTMLQSLVLMIMLSALAMTGTFLFRPMARRIEQEKLILQKEIAVRTQTQKELEKINEFNNTLLGTIPLGIDIVDQDGNILYMNKRLGAAFGKDSIGQKCYQLYKDDKRQCENCPLKGGVSIGQSKSLVLEGAMAGRTFLVNHTGMLYDDKPAVLEVFEDITDYRRMQERMRESERLAWVGQMAGAIAHEFRNELGAMRNAVYFLKMRSEGADEKVKRYLKILDDEIINTEQIIESLLAFARTGEPKFARMDLKAILTGAIEKSGIPENVRVTTHIDETLGEIQADPVQLMLLFVNIISNALQAMKGEGQLAIEANASKEDGCLKIAIKDTGCGMRDDEKRQLFGPFFSTKARGVGLGLATAKAIVERHKGSIDVESELGKGTQVTIRLPIGITR